MVIPFDKHTFTRKNNFINKYINFQIFNTAKISVSNINNAVIREIFQIV